MAFTPTTTSEWAGLVLLQNNESHFRFVVSQNGDGEQVVKLIERKAGSESILAERAINGASFTLKVQARGQAYSFYIVEETHKWQVIAEAVNGRILSTNIAGGFVGAYIGMYASSNGAPSSVASADFDWFEYISTD
jgi:alpha-N-arabinofuranosidase